MLYDTHRPCKMDEDTPTFLLRPLNREISVLIFITWEPDHSCVGVCVCPQTRVKTIMLYLEDMCFEDVMAQLNSLLPVQLVLLPREPERQ